MGRIARLNKREILERLYLEFQHKGYDGASIKALGEACDLSKASLYHHFPKGKADMAQQVLGLAGRQLQEMVLAPLSKADEGADRLRHSLEGVKQYYKGDIPVCLMNSLLMGEGRVLFGGNIAKVVVLWQGLLEQSLMDQGISRADSLEGAKDIMQTIQGSLILARVQADRVPFEQAIDGLIHLYA